MTNKKRDKRRKRKRRAKMSETIPEAATPDAEPQYEPKIIPPAYSLDAVEAPAPMSMARLRAYLMPLANGSLALRDGLEAILEHPHAVETLGDLAEPLRVQSDKLWRLMLAAMARSS